MEENSEINKLKTLIKQIFSLYTEKKETVAQLLSKNKELEEIIEQKNNKLKESEKKQETLKMAKTISLTDEDKTDVKNKINKIVREIDKSIGLLNE